VWASGLTGCMFAVESLAFNGVMLAAAARFVLAPPNARVQQAQYARRLFFASLGYLPLFFGCLLLHQQSNRHAATEDEEVAAPEAARARLREARRAGGRGWS
jgi:heme O synthase-like polyprenyltransferase